MSISASIFWFVCSSFAEMSLLLESLFVSVGKKAFSTDGACKLTFLERIAFLSLMAWSRIYVLFSRPSMSALNGFTVWL
jgi:hypothetical protein